MLKRFSRFLRSYGAVALILLLATLVSISTTAYFSARFVHRVFGDISLSQIILNINPKGAEAARDMVIHESLRQILIYSGRTLLALVAIWFFAILATRRYHFRKILPPQVFRICTVVAFLGFFVFQIQSIVRQFSILSYFKVESSTFIEENYARLDPTKAVHADGHKRNLIVIFLESMESGFRNPSVYGENLIPELERLEGEGLRLEGYHRTPGGYFTLDGISAQFLGMPLTQLPVDIHNVHMNKVFGGLLSNTDGIFNVLQNDGYITASFHGTSREFSNKGLFMHRHGITEAFFAEDWSQRGYPLDEKNRGRWDYNDDFLMARFKEWLVTPKEKPFAVFFETVDTHFPVGFTPAEERIKGNQEESIQHASRLIDRFILWAKTQPWYADTTIYIAGDHPWQDSANDFTKLTKKDPNRGIYSVFLNPVRTDLKVRPCGFAAMDIAPTILNAMGVTFTSEFHGQTSHSQLGLGRSLFDDGENLVCRYGVEDFKQRLQSYSAFYNTLQ